MSKDQLIITKLDKETEACTEKLTARIPPALKRKIVEISECSNRTISDIVKRSLEWVMERIVIEESFPKNRD